MKPSHGVISLVCLFTTALLLGGCDREQEASSASNGSRASDVTQVAHSHENGETCFVCDATKRDAGRLWCTEHARYEDRCWICQPQLEDSSRPYCDEHYLYEDECHLCNPALDASENAADESSGGLHKHSADEACFICDPAKRDEGRLWCSEHARYEDRCWICQPQLEDADRAYCEEHFLYEDECHLCNPALLGDASATPSRDGAPSLFCHEHGVDEIECGICQPQLAGTLEAGESLLVRMPSARSAELAGLTLEQPNRGDASASISLLGEVRYNGNRLAKLTPLAPGVITDIRVDVGDQVEEGQILAVINSVAVAQAKSAYLSKIAEVEARTTVFEREQKLVNENIAARRDFQDAQAALKLAELEVRRTHQQLINLGFTESEVADIAAEQSSSSDLYVRAPFAGSVVERTAVLGEAADSEGSLFEIADLSTMWIELAVPEEQAFQIERGGEIVASVRALPELEIPGQITWISPRIDERTRMVRARATVQNDRGILRHGMFTEVSAMIGGTSNSLLVPGEAVHEIDGTSFVFVRQEPDLFAVRRVDVGPRTASGTIAILAGLTETESVVTGGSFTMKTEFLKSRLGAGCVDD
ncbi:MAG: efflux RND transporter periplasmic adaptor subunit [Phycisphaerales bacterium]